MSARQRSGVADADAFAHWRAALDTPGGDGEDDEGAFESTCDTDDEDEEGVAWQAARTWACGVCTFSENWQSDAACAMCGAACAADADARVVAVIWRCSVCTLDNAAPARACEACGEAAPSEEAPQTRRRQPAGVWPGAPSGEEACREWRCGECTLVNAPAQPTCIACGASLEDGTRVDGSAARGARGCVACTPRRACPAHVASRLRNTAAARGEGAEARELRRTAQWLAWEEAGLLPLRRLDADDEAASLRCVDGATRRATLRTAAATAHTPRRAAPPPSADALRSMYASAGGADDSDDADAASAAFCSDWEEGREPRQRVDMLLAAGWFPVRRGRVGGVGSHPKWRRVLPDGTAQVLSFASTPSCVRAWDNTAAALQRMDREALARIQAADAEGDPER
jgi:hypothetical protein